MDAGTMTDFAVCSFSRFYRCCSYRAPVRNQRKKREMLHKLCDQRQFRGPNPPSAASRVTDETVWPEAPGLLAACCRHPKLATAAINRAGAT
jgi:hypothetical protein